MTLIQHPKRTCLAWLQGLQNYIHHKSTKINIRKRVFDRGELDIEATETEPLPTTLIRFDEEDEVTLDGIQQKVKAFSSRDDVFCHAFLGDIVIAT